MNLFFKLNMYQTKLINSPPNFILVFLYIFIIDNWHYYLFMSPEQETEYIFDSSLISNIRLITKSPLDDFIQNFIISLKSLHKFTHIPLP